MPSGNMAIVPFSVLRRLYTGTDLLLLVVCVFVVYKGDRSVKALCKSSMYLPPPYGCIFVFVYNIGRRACLRTFQTKQNIILYMKNKWFNRFRMAGCREIQKKTVFYATKNRKEESVIWRCETRHWYGSRMKLSKTGRLRMYVWVDVCEKIVVVVVVVCVAASARQSVQQKLRWWCVVVVMVVQDKSYIWRFLVVVRNKICIESDRTLRKDDMKVQRKLIWLWN